jgi:hypothetical protein
MPKRLKKKPAPTSAAYDPTPEIIGDFRSMLSAYMAKLGAKGGATSGARRMTNLTKRQRTEIARKGGLARAKKAKSPERS